MDSSLFFKERRSKMKYLKNCFIIGFGAAIVKFGWETGNFVTAAPIGKMAEKLADGLERLEERAEKLRVMQEQRKWREAAENKKKGTEQNADR